MATPKNQSVVKAFTILKAFHRHDEWLTNCELSRRAKLPEASGYRLIQTLVEIGAVVRGPGRRYRPGMLLVSLSRKVAIGELLHDASLTIATELSRRLKITVHVGILESGMVTYLVKACTPTSFQTHTRPGSQLEAYCSALGKVLLAALPEEQLEGFIMEGDLVALTPFTITDRAILRAQLSEVRLRGFAVDDRECRADMRCVAVPIHDNDGCTVAAMSITTATHNMPRKRVSELRDELVRSAAELESKVFPSQPQIRDTGLPSGAHLHPALSLGSGQDLISGLLSGGISKKRPRVAQATKIL